MDPNTAAWAGLQRRGQNATPAPRTPDQT